MFQTFEVSSSPDTGPARVKALRGEMKARQLDGFLVPRADKYQGEYVASCDERLAWLTGFTGSAGFCAVLSDIAGVFIDGRYRVQVRDQIAGVFTPVHWPETSLADWLKEQLPDGGVVGFDPWLHTVTQIRDLKTALDPAGITLEPVDNLVDAIWDDRPAPPRNPVRIQPDELAGESHESKRTRLAAALDQDTRAFIALPDSICWLLNIRGTDIPRNPVVQSYAILNDAGQVAVFSDATFDDAALSHLSADVTVHGVADLGDYISTLDGTLQVAPTSTPNAVLSIIDAPQLAVTAVDGVDPCILPKARKNTVEIAGSREAHLRDGAAMVRFLAWLEDEAPKGQLTEIDVVKSLEGFRRDTNALQDISFETISGAGPNGAIVHYRVNEDTNRAVDVGELLLVDSGGQYLDGTTDITRTIAVGETGDEEKSCYTRVLQGMIAISRVRFPKGVRGRDLDALARYPLWLAGQDYDHGTGHGVGSYLSVHEGPQGLSRRADTVLETGMILSNEPGYYREGAFGIRIENLITVREAAPVTGGDARDMLDFETLTFVPLDRTLVDVTQLTDDERAWIDQYHSDTLRKIGPRVDGRALEWLTAACAPL
ncbi:aminopeptidase P family protein [Octadecabacter sp. 1_MG-2023]|uniref:aminopeptidase P family protein n=1 Tax=unclassified Octadecabacter TaxID=196158 RepID=UPI001C08428C|nr:MULTISPECIES: aminopeptidase P family protein [unclassified Octadecabacter]MBU2992948.1 aminopeptidase P family protein [Octadecabacter sp. B2R22]MDO6733601.1 aminopeptidase P family protein [Octadecabacter sp. 1_MG-2023]